jgi:homoserine dehydrogenase
MLRPLRIGMVGAGTVGGGVYEIVMGRLLEERASHGKRPLWITKICVKVLSKPRSFHLDDSITTLTTHIENIIEDPDIDLVIEVMGGTGLAKEVVEGALKNNKMVVTANKELISENLEELERLIHQQTAYHNNNNNNNKQNKKQQTTGFGFGYEAAVCGGIPIIQTLQSCYSGDVIHKLQGIVNGTTNYMLGKMQAGADFETVLQEAQELGYAEADPTADVEGYDVRAKICLLAKLAFGVTVPPSEVPCKGISELSSVDFEYAKLLGCTIKLLGTAERLHEAREWDGPLCVFVSPVMIPSNKTLAGITRNGNAVAVTSSNMGTCCYTGQGAGRFPTANSIVADLVRLADGQAGAAPFPLQAELDLDFDYDGSFYIRIPYADGLGIIKRVGELAEDAGVSIHSILQNPIRDRMSADFVVTTEEAKVSQIQSLCESINAQHDFCRAPCIYMPMLVDDVEET